MRWFCWHDWSKWQTYVWHGTIIPWEGASAMSAQRTKQARICFKCGLEFHRVVEDASGNEYEKIAIAQEAAQ